MTVPAIGLALQGGGAHGAFTWGALDRLLEEVEAGTLAIAAISGASAGAINAAVTAAGLVEGGPKLARTRLGEFWRGLAARGARLGNAWFFGEPGPFGGWNIDWSPAAIALEATGLVVSPYTNPFYADPLAPLLEAALPRARLARLNADEGGPRLFLAALNVATNARKLFSQPDISVEALRASACLPSEFKAVDIAGAPYWDGGYIGNPPLAPLVDVVQDLLLVMANPLRRDDMPPRNPRAILSRLNEVTFNASVVLELNAICAVNHLLADVRASGLDYHGKYRPVHLHMIRDDAYLARLGVVSKSSTSLPFLEALHAEGRAATARFLDAHCGTLGERSSLDAKSNLLNPLLKG